MVRHTIIDMNLVELTYYSFMISLGECTGCTGSFIVLSPKICLPKQRIDINVKTFKMITNKYEAKAMTEHISCHISSDPVVDTVGCIMPLV